MQRGAALRLFGAAVLCCAVVALGACTWFCAQPEVDFEWTPATGAEPLVVDFVPVVGEGATAYAWDFGDGSKSIEEKPSHIYYADGAYTVTLTVAYEGGRVSVVQKPGCIEVTAISAKEYVPYLYVLSADEGVIRYADLDVGMIVDPDATPPVLQELVTSIHPGTYSGEHYTLAAGHATGERYAYWTEETKLYRRAVVAGGTTRIFVPLLIPVGLCVDSVHSKLYEVELPTNAADNSGPGSIRRWNLDGTSVETLASSWILGQVVPWFVSVDPSAHRLYYVRMPYGTDDDVIFEPLAAGTSTIDATPLDQYSAQTLVTDLDVVGGMAVDAGLSAGARYIYWTVPGAGRIDRCKVDGSGVTQLMTGLTSPGAIVVDVGRGLLYWAESDGVHRANLDGTNARLIYPGVVADALAIG
ncbi:MAG: PKD domain-containing protein [Candidatus Bipolaricaulota bacterium]|nr:PKD domain-containing protein [Candidatus Bipolaricaulota bacterium]